MFQIHSIFRQMYSLLIMGALLILVGLGTIFFHNGFCDSETASDPYPHVTIPIYPHAGGIHKYANPYDQIKSTSYKVKQQYPATKIIEFYDSMMIREGFIPYQQLDPQEGKWVAFEDGTGDSGHCVRQFSKTWIAKDTKIKAILFMRYQAGKKNSWSEDLQVTLQLMQAFDEQALTEFFHRLEAEGKSQEFMKLLKRYTTRDQDVDFERAIRENPDNHYLKEYRSITEEVNRSLKTEKPQP